MVYMYLTGNDKPSYRTIINFKNEYGSLIEEVLVLTIGVAREAGMVKLNDLAIDSTTIKANSSSSSIIKENNLELARKIIKEGKETDIIEDEKYGDKRGDEVPQDLTLKKKIKKLIKKVTTEEECVDEESIVFTKKEVEKLDHVYEELEKIKETHENKDKEFSISLTDPEARWMKNKKGKIEQSLNIQNIVDVEEGIILKSEVVQDPTDHHQLPIQIEGLKEILENDLKETNILADNGYNTSKSAKYLHDNDLNGFMPNRAQTSAKKNKIKKFSKAQFQYNIEKNTYTCPNNRILPYKKTYDIDGKKRKVFYTKDCKNCQYKEECTPHSNYRIISHYSTNYQDLMSQKNG
ncbi:hypothetical protein MBCUT_02530 [Methanobrevibacter cuticularis]|uniref:Transposase DDE domain-containing protein n=2 Tax=Methanobrevibacter cuticularis TaxID=47311 RepID=A0A166F771_9EURY|nr:hypothetical protein MBCUT_02530 [Methanobrevibacter cuticularis]